MVVNANMCGAKSFLQESNSGASKEKKIHVANSMIFLCCPCRMSCEQGTSVMGVSYSLHP